MSAEPVGLPGGVSLGSAPSEELREELERLRAIERRAQKVAAAVVEPVTVFNVRYILTGETE